MANPKIGQSATLNGKKVVWSGQNYGWQSPAQHTKLANDGKFRVGTQALDRISQSVSRAIPKPIKDYAKGVAQEGARQQASKDRVLQRVGVDTSKPDATTRTLDAASKASNVDRRIVGAAATAAQAAISSRALKVGATKPASQPRSVGAAAKADVAAKAGTRSIHTPAKSGVVSRSGQPVRETVSRYTPQVTNKTVNTPETRRFAANNSTAAQRSNTNAATKAADTANTGRTNRVINNRTGTNPRTSTPSTPSGPVTASKGASIKGRALPAQPSATGQPRARIQRDIPAVQGNKATRARNALDGKPTPARSTNNRLAPGVRNSATVKPPRSSTSKPTKAEQVRQVKSALRDQGPDHAAQVLKGQDAAKQARGTKYSQGKDTRTGGQWSDATKASAPKPYRGDGPKVTNSHGRVRANTENYSMEAGQRFKSKASKVVSDAMDERGWENAPGKARRSYRNKLEKRAKEGVARVKAAARGEATASQRTTRANTADFTGTGRQAYQDPNKSAPNPRRTNGLTESQMRRRSGRVRTSEGPTSTYTASNPKAEARAALSNARRDAQWRSGSRATPIKPRDGVRRATVTSGKPAKSQGNRTTPKPRQPYISPQEARRLAKLERQATEKLRSLQTGKKVTIRDGTKQPDKVVNVRNLPQRETVTGADKVRQARSDAALRRRNRSVTRNKGVDRHGNDLNKIMQDASAERSR
jgi:hypothetical protein